MSSEWDAREDYAALVRALSARLELELGFGIDAWRLPLPPLAAAEPATAPRPAQAQRPAASAPARPRQATRPAPPAVRPPPAHRAEVPPPPSSAPTPPRPVTTEGKVDIFDASAYDIKFPDGLSRQEQLEHFARAIANCTLCPLCAGRTQVVFGVGDAHADLMFVGEAPGHDEDVQGEPFVGKAGQLLTRIIEAMGFKRGDCYIANVNKCRPPNNRAPTPEEMERCRPFLLRQIDIVQPKVICLLGATAVRGLLQSKESISSLRGRFLRWRGLLVMPTFHPAYLLRNPGEKRAVWQDVQKVRDFLLGKLTV